MAYYIVKCTDGTFVANEQPEGFIARSAIENRFFICESPTPPNGDFVVEWPDILQADYIFYLFPNGKKLWYDPFFGKVEFGDEVDNKGRREVKYTEEQNNKRLTLIKWFILNVWIPDKERMFSIDATTTNIYRTEAEQLNTAEAASTYLRKNLHYDL